MGLSALPRKLWGWLCHWGHLFARSRRQDAVAFVEFEATELENVFALLLMGSFVGMPSPPSFVAVELLPYMSDELRTLNRRAEQSSDMFAEMVGTLGID